MRRPRSFSKIARFFLACNPILLTIGASSQPVMTLPRTLCSRVFRIDARETDYVRRGFRGASDSMRNRLERIGAIFADGYHSALESPTERELVERLEAV